MDRETLKKKVAHEITKELFSVNNLMIDVDVSFHSTNAEVDTFVARVRLSKCNIEVLEEICQKLKMLCMNKETFECGGRLFLLGDSNDPEAVWFADGFINIWLRTWKEK